MKTKLFILGIFISLCSYSQIKKMNSFNKYYLTKGVVSDNKQLYFSHQKGLQQNGDGYIRIYDSNFKMINNFFYKSGNKSGFVNSSVVDFGDFEKQIYAANNKISFWVTFTCSVSGMPYYWSAIIDESGNTLTLIDSCNNLSLSGNPTIGFKLLCSNYYNYKVDLYSLPGKGFIDTLRYTKTVIINDTIFKHNHDTVYSSSTTVLQDDNPLTLISQNSSKLLKAFPNPSSSFINIPYEISVNGSLELYNSSGVKIDAYPLSSSSNSIIIDISKLKIGNYSYSFFSGKTRISSGTFIKN